MDRYLAEHGLPDYVYFDREAIEFLYLEFDQVARFERANYVRPSRLETFNGAEQRKEELERLTRRNEIAIEKIGISRGIFGMSDNYDSVKLEPMRESDPPRRAHEAPPATPPTMRMGLFCVMEFSSG